MAADPAKYRDPVKRAVEHLLEERLEGTEPASQQRWVMIQSQIAICLAEYHLITADKRVLPYLQELHDELVNGLYDDYTGGHFYRVGFHPPDRPTCSPA